MSTTIPLVAVGLGVAYMMIQPKKRDPKEIDRLIKERVAIEEIESMIKKKGDPAMVKFMDTPASQAPAIDSIYTPEVATKMNIADMGWDKTFDTEDYEFLSPPGEKLFVRPEKPKPKPKQTIDDSLMPFNELADGTESAFLFGYDVPTMMGGKIEKYTDFLKG